MAFLSVTLPKFPAGCAPWTALGVRRFAPHARGCKHLHPRRCAATPPAAARRRGMLALYIDMLTPAEDAAATRSSFLLKAPAAESAATQRSRSSMVLVMLVLVLVLVLCLLTKG